MNRSFLLGVCLLGLATYQSAQASPTLSALAKFHALTDSIAPVISCPADDTVQLSAGQCGQMVQYQVLATDDQPGVIVVQALGIASGANFPIGVTVNHFVALDVAGNTSTCSFTITVWDFATILYCKDVYTAQVNANCAYTLS